MAAVNEGEIREVRDLVVHIADLHFWEIVFKPWLLLNKRLLGNANVLLRRRRQYIMRNAERFLDAVEETGSRFAVLTGDFTSTATEGEFRMGARFAESLQARGFTLAVMPGNHDVYTFSAARRRRFEHHFHSTVPVGGYPAAVTLPGGTPLVLVPTVVPNRISSTGMITDAEADATRALLAACPEGPVLVAGHYPILHRTHAYHSKPSRRLRNAAALHRALGESGRKILYIAGHVHACSYVRDHEFPHLTHLTTDAFFQRRRRDNVHGGFATIACTAAGFEVTRYLHGEDWRCEPLELQAAPPPRKE